MNIEPTAVEQRLADAFKSAGRVEPSDDLWSRVLHSIEEDKTHRRRVVRTAVTCTGLVVALVVAAVPFLREDLIGVSIDPVAYEVLVTLTLTILVAVFGPAIRRFGRNYTADLWPHNPTMATSILRLLDIAYFLVFAGYILVTARFGDNATPRTVVLRDHLAEQLADASVRIGGLLLLIGVLHALTMLTLPFIALVDNSTRVGRRLPRWLTIAGIIVLAWIGMQLAGLMMIGIVGIAD